jgi:hypothetical protein
MSNFPMSIPVRVEVCSCRRHATRNAIVQFILIPLIYRPGFLIEYFSRALPAWRLCFRCYRLVRDRRTDAGRRCFQQHLDQAMHLASLMAIDPRAPVLIQRIQEIREHGPVMLIGERHGIGAPAERPAVFSDPDRFTPVGKGFQIVAAQDGGAAGAGDLDPFGKSWICRGGDVQRRHQAGRPSECGADGVFRIDPAQRGRRGESCDFRRTSG